LMGYTYYYYFFIIACEKGIMHVPVNFFFILEQNLLF
jgi:hypothetical protein